MLQPMQDRGRVTWGREMCLAAVGEAGESLVLLPCRPARPRPEDGFHPRRNGRSHRYGDEGQAKAERLEAKLKPLSHLLQPLSHLLQTIIACNLLPRSEGILKALDQGEARLRGWCV